MVSGDDDEIDDSDVSVVSENIVDVIDVSDKDKCIGDGVNVKVTGNNFDEGNNVNVGDGMMHSLTDNITHDNLDVIEDLEYDNYDDGNVDGDNISALPRTICDINAQCTGKSDYYATSLKIIIKALEEERHKEQDRTRSATSLVEKERDINSVSLQQRKKVVKD